MLVGITVLGIEDTWVWMAYVLCLAATALCVIYALVMRNRQEREAATPADQTWAAHERQVEEEV